MDHSFSISQSDKTRKGRNENAFVVMSYFADAIYLILFKHNAVSNKGAVREFSKGLTVDSPSLAS